MPAIVVFEAVDRKARDGADAGFAGDELRPIVGLAVAERGHDAHAGDDDDGTPEFVAWCSHVDPRLSWSMIRKSVTRFSEKIIPKQ
ncbi:hypothetical protein ACVWZ6_004766 [Bradyrhizobium sp. GM6.1]